MNGYIIFGIVLITIGLCLIIRGAQNQPADSTRPMNLSLEVRDGGINVDVDDGYGMVGHLRAKMPQ